MYDIPDLNFLQIREIAKDIYEYNKTILKIDQPSLPKKRCELTQFIHRNYETYKLIYKDELSFVEAKIEVDSYSLSQIRDLIKNIWEHFPAIKDKMFYDFPLFNLNNKKPILIKYYNDAINILECKRLGHSDTEDEYNYANEDLENFFNPARIKKEDTTILIDFKNYRNKESSSESETSCYFDLSTSNSEDEI